MAQRGAKKNILSAKNSRLEWIMVRKNDTNTLDYLRDEFYYHDIDLVDVGPPMQSPKITLRSEYAFMVLQLPILDKKSGIFHTAEIDFFIEKNRLVTVDVAGVRDLQEFFEIFQKNYSPPKTTAKNIADDIPHLTYQVIDTLIQSLYPDLRILSTDIEKIEDNLFNNYGKDFISELLRVKTNIVRSRQAMQGHDEILTKLASYLSTSMKMPKKLDAYYQQLVDDSRDIKNRLLLKKETIDALHDTNRSLTDFRTNEIIKTLTIVSFIVFPLTLMAGIFGMNAINMPFVNHPQGFWIIISLMFVGCLAMLGFFKYKKWM